MLYQLIRDKAKWVVKKHKQHCRIIDVVLIVLLLICVL